MTLRRAAGTTELAVWDAGCAISKEGGASSFTYAMGHIYYKNVF
jgi:hypothetical protein